MNYVSNICYIAAAVCLVFSICMPVSAAGDVSIGAGPGSWNGYGGDSAGPENASLQKPVMTQNPDRVTVRDQDRVQAQECSPDEACNATRLRAMVAERNQVFQTGADGTLLPGNITERAVYAFRAAAPLTGGNAPDLIRLSEEINGSVKSAAQNEERIRSQNGFLVFLFGGDQASADGIMQHVVQNRARIEEMNRLIDECGCDPETAAILREQVQAMEQEQARFEEVAAAENGKRGIFGIFG
jgi:hypothetical protein